MEVRLNPEIIAKGHVLALELLEAIRHIVDSRFLTISGHNDFLERALQVHKI